MYAYLYGCVCMLMCVDVFLSENVNERICEHMGVFEYDFTAIRCFQISLKISTEAIKLVHEITIHCNIIRV